jgi:hypothetical protein
VAASGGAQQAPPGDPVGPWASVQAPRPGAPAHAATGPAAPAPRPGPAPAPRPGPAPAPRPGPARAPRPGASWDEDGPDRTANQALAGYTARAEELFTRIEHCLAKGADCTTLSAPVYELADDLASVGSHKPLVKAMRELAEALRDSLNPRPELAAARKAFADALVPPPPGRARRHEWWRAPGS